MDTIKMKSKSEILAAAVVAMLLVTSAANAAGTGVGNGGNSARDQYIEKLKRDLVMTSPGIVSAGTNPRDIIDWCSRVSATLMRERQRAMLQYQYNRSAAAEQILIDALIVASQSIAVDPEIGGPMTKKLIDRALMYSQALDQALPAEIALSMTTKLNFLFKSVDFIVEVSRDLDMPYYIQYRYQYGGCRECPPTFDLAGFQGQFVRMAARQLSFVTNNLTEVLRTGGRLEVFPLGDPRGFLTVSELTSAFVAQDLRDNLHAYANACAIRDLESLSQTLTAFNLYGDRTIYPNDRWAVSQVREEMERLEAQIQSSVCPGFNR